MFVLRNICHIYIWYNKLNINLSADCTLIDTFIMMRKLVLVILITYFLK